MQRNLPDVDRDTAFLHIGTMRAGRLMEGVLLRVLRSEGVERSEHSVMVALWFARPMRLSPTQLSGAIAQTTSGMSKTLRRLEGNRMIERTSDPADGRGQLVGLTRRGQTVVERHLKELMAYWTDCLHRLSQRERADLRDAVWSLVSVLEGVSGEAEAEH